MTWEPALVADGLVNLFGAGSALVVAAEANRADPKGPVTRRIVFALRFVAALFLVRAVAWLTQDRSVDTLVVFLASATPLASLIVAEGLLRRHGPRWLKLALCIGPFAVAVGSVLPFLPAGTEDALLLATVLFGFVAVASFLLLRDNASLTVGENAAVRRVLFALLILTPMIATDFRSIVDTPVRLGAAGGMLVLYVGLGSGNAQSSMAMRLASVGVFLAVAAVLAFGFAVSITPSPTTAEVVRVWAVGFAGLMFAALFSEAQGARAERNRTIAPLMDAASPAEFADRLKRHPLLGDARILEGRSLDHVRHPAFEALLAEERILRRAAAPWRRPEADDGVERALSLLTAHDATHLMLLTREPLRLVAFAVPATAADPRTDNEIQLARRVGELVYEREIRA